MEKQVINSKMEVARREEQNDWKADKRGTLDDDPIECIIADNKIVEKRVIARKSSIVSYIGHFDHTPLYEYEIGRLIEVQ